MQKQRALKNPAKYKRVQSAECGEIQVHETEQFISKYGTDPILNALKDGGACSGKINPEFFIDSMTESDYILVSTGRELRVDRARVLCGVALVRRVDDELHIDVVCSNRSRGAALVQRVERLAQDLRVSKVTLDAMPDVLGFYQALGYTIGPPVPPRLIPLTKSVLKRGFHYKPK